MKNNIGLIINPTAHSGKAKSDGKKLIKYFNHHGLSIVNLSGNNWKDTIKNAKSGLIKNKLDALVVAGGDGTAHLGANIVAETGLPFGLVSIGTGNDAARGLGLPENNMKKSADVIISGLKNDDITPIDLGYATTLKETAMHEWFLSNAGGGFITKVSKRKEFIKFPRGSSRYMISLFIELMLLKPEKYKVTIDGKTQKFESLMFGVGNGPDIGGGMILFPNASFDNHELDFTSVVPMSRKRFINLAGKVKKDDLTNEPELYIQSGNEIIVESIGKNETIFADGEDIGDLPMRYTVVPNALHIIGGKPLHRTKLSENRSKVGEK